MASQHKEVRHAQFGEGTVIAEDFGGDDPKLTIDFRDHGQKTVLARSVRLATDGRPWPIHAPNGINIGGVWFTSCAPLSSQGHSSGVLRAQTFASQALEIWELLYYAAPTAQLWPVIIDDEDCCEIDWEFDEEMAALRRQGEPATGMPYLQHVAGSPAEALSLAETLSFPELLAASVPDDNVSELLTQQAEAQGAPSWFDMQDPSEEGEVAHFALVTADAAWKVPAFLPRGGGNDAPARAQLIKLMQHYAERYQPVLLRIQYPIELYVATRPQSTEEARSLAVEHLRFCPQLLDDPTMSFDKYVSFLLESNRWYFYWD